MIIKLKNKDTLICDDFQFKCSIGKNGLRKNKLEGDRWLVKLIEVKPNASLSLQMHHHRAEHWIVVNGTALIEKNGEKQLLSENESTFIPLGCKHRLSNPGKMKLELIEVQSGAYLDEEDIIRFEDSYGRIKNLS